MMLDVIPQTSPAWGPARIGKLTASTIAQAAARSRYNRAAWGISRRRLMTDLLKERLTGRARSGFCNDTMQRGIENEANARAAYEHEAGVTVAPGGFVRHPRIPGAGASPDGFVLAPHGSQMGRLVEFKCPQKKEHLRTLKAGRVPGKHLKQIAWQLACTGCEACDFLSWHPGLPLFLCRVHRDEKMIQELEDVAAGFLAELCEMEQRLRAYFH